MIILLKNDFYQDRLGTNEASCENQKRRRGVVSYRINEYQWLKLQARDDVRLVDRCETTRISLAPFL